MEKITVQNTSVMIISINKNDYISLTDIAKYKSDDPTAVIGNWMRNRNAKERSDMSQSHSMKKGRTLTH